MRLPNVRLNAGGALEPDQVVGREALIGHLVDTLSAQSVLLVAERRSGKTCVLRLLEAKAPRDWAIVKLSVEGVTSPEEFVRRLAEATSLLIPPTRRERLINELDRFGLTGVGAIQRQPSQPSKAPWKEGLDALLSALTVRDQRTVLL